MQEIRAQARAPLDERFADEDLARFVRRDAAIVDASPRRERETVQGRGFERCDEAALFDPVRLAVFALEQMLARRLDPLRLDGGDHAREQARRFHEACGHDPFRRLGSERRTWCDDEPRAAGAFVFPALIERADLTEKACEN